MAKRGRPVKEDAKRGQYRLRMCEEDEAMLDFVCANTGESKAEVIRRGIKYAYNLEKARQILDTQ